VAIERSKERGGSSVTQIQLKRGTGVAAEILNTADFLTRLNVHAPQALVRSFGDLFMLGVLGSNPPHTLIIATVDSFQNAFPGMLEWESRMAEDLLPIFAEEETIKNVPTSTLWQDAIIGNRDTRILKDPNGNTVLLYAFFDGRLLIITDNEMSFRLISDRLESQKLER